MPEAIIDGTIAAEEGQITFGTSDTDTITNIDGTEINFLTDTKRADNIKDYFGTGDDSSIYNNGTDLIISPADDDNIVDYAATWYEHTDKVTKF